MHLLNIKDGVLWVHGGLVLCSLTDQALLISEGDEGRRGIAALLIRN